MSVNFPKMKPEAKEAWLKALRSGDYRQGTYTLRTADDRFCCLGVFAEINSAPWYLPYSYNFDGEVALYQWPSTVDLNWFKNFFNETDKSDETFRGLQEALIQMNDFKRWSFIDIANWIEKNL